MRYALSQALKICFVALVAGLVVWAAHPGAPAYGFGQPGDHELTVAQAAQLDEPFLWIDARTAEEFAEGHIPGAIHVSEDNWEEGLFRLMEQWEGQALVVYCGSDACASSKQVARRLRQELGIDNAYSLYGGWELWLGETEGGGA